MEFALLPTGIGSMPHSNAQEACNVILENFNKIPFWPQLPKLGFKENMYVQFAYDLPGVALDTEHKKVYLDTSNTAEIEKFCEKLVEHQSDKFAYEKEYFAGFYTMLKNKAKLKNVNMLKGQLAGPISLGMQITDETRRSILYNEFFRDILIKSLKLKAEWQESALRDICRNTIIFFDEPSLSLFGTPYLSLNKEEIMGALSEVCSGLKGLKGIHCCGNTDWAMILDLPIDIISFDAYSYGDRLALYPEKIKNFIVLGGALAWGIVPSVEEKFRAENLDMLIYKFDTLLKNFAKKGISEKELLKASLLTPSCGLAGMSIESAEKALKTTKELSDRLRKRYRL